MMTDRLTTLPLAHACRVIIQEYSSSWHHWLSYHCAVTPCVCKPVSLRPQTCSRNFLFVLLHFANGHLFSRIRPLPSATLDLLHHQHTEGSNLVLEVIASCELSSMHKALLIANTINVRCMFGYAVIHSYTSSTTFGILVPRQKWRVVTQLVGTLFLSSDIMKHCCAKASVLWTISYLGPST